MGRKCVNAKHGAQHIGAGDGNVVFRNFDPVGLLPAVSKGSDPDAPAGRDHGKAPGVTGNAAQIPLEIPGSQ